MSDSSGALSDRITIDIDPIPPERIDFEAARRRRIAHRVHSINLDLEYWRPDRSGGMRFEFACDGDVAYLAGLYARAGWKTRVVYDTVGPKHAVQEPRHTLYIFPPERPS